MPMIRYGGTGGGYRIHNTVMRDPILGLDLQSLAQLVKQAGGVLYLDARKADGYNNGINSPLTNPLIDLTKLGNNATLTNFAATQTDGYTLEATVNSNGSDVGYANLVVNGDFSQGTTGWTTDFISGFSVVGGIAQGTANTQFGSINSNNLNFETGKRYYVRGKLQADSTQCRLLVQQISSPFSAVTVSLSDGLNTLREYSSIVTSNFTGSGRVRASDWRTTGWTQMRIDDIQLINLTDNPQIQALETQLGRQLKVEECDRIFPFTATTGVTKVSARPYIATDGLDSYGLLSNSPSVDIMGTGSFAYATGFITPTTLVTGALYFDGNNGSVLADRKICPILVSDGSLTLTLEGTSITLASVGTIKPNTYCDIRIIRDLGVLKCTINGVETYSLANTTNLVAKPYKRLFAITTNVGGTTHGTYLKALSSHEVLASGSDVSKLNGVLDKLVKDYRTVI